ncbi:hypothetical protein LCGC14_0688450 [marine sediment metagenome]|uniref:DUF4386 domain-containing protein n=1 Tax=marine sediment metagenome TaxID=412755 RepID=A0A0F9QL65_9ZZZZ
MGDLSIFFIMERNFFRITGLANIISAVFLLLFWFLYAILLPINEVATNYASLVTDPEWFLVNGLGVIGFILALIGILGIFFKQFGDLTELGMISFLITFVGQVLYNAGIFYETFIWPVLAKQPNIPNLIDLSNGPIYGNPVFFMMLILAGSIYAIGFLIFGYSTYKAKSFPKWAILLLVIGVVSFIPGFFPYAVRTVGIIAYAGGLIWVGYVLFKQE